MTENERRKFLKAAGASLAGAMGMSVVGCQPNGAAPDTADVPAATPKEIVSPPTVEKIAVDPNAVKRAELVKRLKKLALSEPAVPEASKPEIHAMCYFPIYVPPPEQYPCPACGKTMIAGQIDPILSQYDVPVKRVRDLGLDMELIRPEHCATCGDGLRNGKYRVEIRYPDDPTVVQADLRDVHDLERMALFMQGEELEGDIPLKYRIERLRYLFGLKEKNKE